MEQQILVQMFEAVQSLVVTPKIKDKNKGVPPDDNAKKLSPGVPPDDNAKKLSPEESTALEEDVRIHAEKLKGRRRGKKKRDTQNDKD